ncbi:serine/threonine protein kinase [Pleurocapsales cyanobacterium LEGE 06147]|nr:serine/threonine protein kinase [Pleurocapsales cyanobacterium LEGE 06147]
MTRDPNYGRLLANRYQIAELIGEGAMGRVYRARDTLLGGVTVAIKFLAQTLLNHNMRDRFEREAMISALLGEKSIHVVRVRDYGVDEHNIPFYVMEFLSGENLSELIRHQPLSLSRFLNLTRHICLGLESAHQGILLNGELCQIVHRDIKPSNILILEDPTLGEVAKILDFGIAKLVQSDVAQTQSFMGTLAYCSPEQMEGKELDRRSDIYSLGVMMYEMLTTDMPLLPQNSSFGGWYQAHHNFQPEPFNSSLNLPSAIQNLVMGCLAKAKEERPQSVGEIVKVLEALQQQSKLQQLNLELVQIEKVEPKVEYHKPRVEQENVTLEAVPSLTEICLQATWPEDKPIQKIVFPELISTPLGEIPALLVMLDHQDILNRLSSRRCNQFLFMSHPHPMLLWITLLYRLHYEPRWLPCYLDLKTQKGQQIIRTLEQLGSYRILFFALERSKRCQNVMSSTINPQNCTMLRQWADMAQLIPSGGKPQVTRQLLKQELEKLKPKILLKMQSFSTSYSTDISG